MAKDDTLTLDDVLRLGRDAGVFDDSPLMTADDPLIIESALALVALKEAGDRYLSEGRMDEHMLVGRKYHRIATLMLDLTGIEFRPED